MDVSYEQIDILTELINIGVGQAAGILNEMMTEHITMEVLSVKVTPIEDLLRILEQSKLIKQSIVRMGFKGSITGNALLVFPPESASKLVSIITTDEISSIEVGSLQSGTLSEIGNILLSAVMSVLANILAKHLNYTVPSYYEDSLLENIQKIANHDEKVIIIAETRFSVATHAIQGEIAIIFEVQGFQNLLTAINNLDN